MHVGDWIKIFLSKCDIVYSFKYRALGLDYFGAGINGADTELYQLRGKH